MVESGAFFQYSGFLGEKSLFLGEKVHRPEKRTEEQRTVQYSRADQSREEKKRVDITAENSRAEQN